MPELNQISCHLEFGDTDVKAKGYGIQYTDKHVSCYVAIPSEPLTFSIVLDSHGYLAPGLAAFVYIDGLYQCNRHRVGLVAPARDVSQDQYQVHFRFRQKEERLSNGTMIGRDWSFSKLNVVSLSDPPKLDAKFLRMVGTIEVIILRCKEGDGAARKGSAIDLGLQQLAVDVSGHSQIKPADHDTGPTKGTAREEQRKVPSVEQKKPPSTIRHQANPEPSKVNSPVPSLGGLWGLFDGANDDRVESKARSQNVRPTGDWANVAALSQRWNASNKDQDAITKTEAWLDRTGPRSSASHSSKSDTSTKPKMHWADVDIRPIGYGAVAASPFNRASLAAGASALELPAYELPAISPHDAKRCAVDHQVKTGMGAIYEHAIARPVYLDDLQSPFARFTFKYRTKQVLEEKFKTKIGESKEEFANRIKHMSHSELQDEVVRLKMAQQNPRVSENDRPPIAKTATARSVKSGWTNNKAGSTRSKQPDTGNNDPDPWQKVAGSHSPKPNRSSKPAWSQAKSGASNGPWPAKNGGSVRGASVAKAGGWGDVRSGKDGSVGAVGW